MGMTDRNGVPIFNFTAPEYAAWSQHNALAATQTKEKDSEILSSAVRAKEHPQKGIL